MSGKQYIAIGVGNRGAPSGSIEGRVAACYKSLKVFLRWQCSATKCLLSLFETVAALPALWDSESWDLRSNVYGVALDKWACEKGVLKCEIA